MSLFKKFFFYPFKYLFLLFFLLSFPLKASAIGAEMIGIGVTATSLGAACLGFFLRLQTSPEFYNKCCGDPHDENSQTTKGKASHNKDLSTDEKSLIIMPPRGPHNSKKNLEEDNFSR